MKHLVIDLGYIEAHTPVRITISGTEANIQLLDASNYSHYKNGRNYRYVGGHYKRSPALLETSHAGHWYVTGDLGGYAGKLGISATVLTSAC
jgi:pyruvate/oxaloacetate carboxyltransferase